MSAVAKTATLPSASPCARSVAASSSSKCSTDAPRRQPIPTASVRGRYITSGRRDASHSPARSDTASAAAYSSPTASANSATATMLPDSGSPAGQSAPVSGSSHSATGSPLTTAAAARVRSVGDASIRHPASFPTRSIAVRSSASAAAVTTACAPMAAATRRASASAPPLCPDSTLTAYRPASSMHTTAGSRPLPPSTGASRRTAAPTGRNTASARPLAKSSCNTGRRGKS